MNISNWNATYDSILQSHVVLKHLSFGNTDGAIVRFDKASDADAFESMMHPKAWLSGICCRVEGYLKTWSPDEHLHNIKRCGHALPADGSGYVAMFKTVRRSQLLEVAGFLNVAFNSDEMERIADLLSTMEWYSLRYVGFRVLRLGIDRSLLMGKQVDEFVESYRCVMRSLYPCVPSRKQALLILNNSGSIYFADFGTGGG